MSNTLTFVLLTLVLVALAFLVRQSAILATRLDRLHWRILTTRDSLALLLDERARYSERIADYPGFTSGESQEIREASTRARRQMIPLVADGQAKQASATPKRVRRSSNFLKFSRNFQEFFEARLMQSSAKRLMPMITGLANYANWTKPPIRSN